MSELHLIADDLTPTTGGPVDYEFAEGCRCYIREYVEYGDVLTQPPGGCPVHSCTCLDAALTGQHSITCLNTALSQPHAMVCPDGDVLYPDNLEDAAMFASGHDALPLNPKAFYALFPEMDMRSGAGLLMIPERFEFQPANPDETPGQIVPGEADTPPAVDLIGGGDGG